MATLEAAISDARKLALELAQDRNQELITGPLTNMFNGKPLDKMLPTIISRLRSCDVVLRILQHLPQTPVVNEAFGLLSDSMKDVAARALFMDRRPDFLCLAHASKALADTIKYDAATIHSESLVRIVYGEEPPFKTIWKPLDSALVQMVDAQEYEALCHFISGAAGINDDNDMGCALGAVTRLALEKCNHTQDSAEFERFSQLAYNMLQLDNEVMGGTALAMTKDEFLEFEQTRGALKQKTSPGLAM